MSKFVGERGRAGPTNARRIPAQPGESRYRYEASGINRMNISTSMEHPSLKCVSPSGNIGRGEADVK
jgi:hypothetical protein